MIPPDSDRIGREVELISDSEQATLLFDDRLAHHRDLKYIENILHCFMILVHVFINWGLLITFVAVLLATIMWDLKRVQHLSEVIHDDHADLWIDLNHSSLTDWYTPLDRCILSLNESIDLNEYITQNCTSFINDDKEINSSFTSRNVPSINIHLAPRTHYYYNHSSLNQLQQICSVGRSIGRICNGPFTKRTYFMKRLQDDHLGDPHSGTLNRALRRLALHNRTIVFIGDGMSKQNQWALVCEITRTANVTIEGDLHGPFIRIRWNKSGLAVDVHYLYMRTLRSFATKTINNNNINNKNNSSYSVPMVKERISQMFANYSGIVFIANVGAWYNSRDRFRYEIAIFLKWLITFSQDNLIFFRETAAQHWNHTDNGYFAKDGSASDGACVPLADYTPILDWRNRDVRMFLENKKLEKSMYIIPFHDVTAPLHTMHPDGPDGKDCTHFCYFPQLWQSVWNELDVHSFNSSKLLTTNNNKYVIIQR